MGLSEQIRQQLINSFKIEQGEHIQKINEGLLALEKESEAAQRQTILNEIFREAHSLKGAARAIGLSTIESLGHALEDLLLSAKEGRLAFSPELFDLLYQALDAVSLVTAQLDDPHAPTPAKVLALLAQLEEIKARDKVVAATPARLESQPQLKPAEPSPDELLAAYKEELAGAELPVTLDDDLSPAELSNDGITTALAQEQNGHSQNGDAKSKTQSPKSEETIRVSVSKLDALMAQFSELLGAKIRAEQRLAEARQMQNLAAAWQKEWQAMRGYYNRLARQKRNGTRHVQHDKEMTGLLEFAAKNQEQLHVFNSQANTLYRQLANDTLRLSLIIDELQEEIKRARMLPLNTVTLTFGRMVRDLAREQGKEITLTIQGGETELDKRVLEQVKDPLIHLLRNAIDHGLETPAERQAAGKAATGQLTLFASQQGHNVVISVSDDGRGLDLKAIRLAAVRKGLLNMAEAEKLSDGEAAYLIFNSGLSTSKIITDISGRGVGLDVVRKNVEELHGILNINSEPGRGITFTMTLPLTLASSRGLLARVGQQIFALPHSTVERMLRLERSAIASVEGKEAITHQNKPVALVWLEDLLELPPGPKDGDLLTIVIIAVAEKRLGLVVDDLVGEQEIVMKSLGRQLVKVGGLAGATVLGTGQVILVLHAADLLKLAARAPKRAPTPLKPHQPEADQLKTILVVDDSITTRTLEKNILEVAGYQVKLATDGEEALAILAAEGIPNLIVSDINMPRLDGFQLTGRIKQDKRYANIPVILVTSLDTPAHKAHGIEVGADAYIVKSKFDQGNLLETIEQLV